jgi:hypothetical protein
VRRNDFETAAFNALQDALEPFRFNITAKPSAPLPL